MILIPYNFFLTIAALFCLERVKCKHFFIKKDKDERRASISNNLAIISKIKNKMSEVIKR